MTKAELIAEMSEASGENKAAVERVLDALRAVVETKLADGEEITLPGIGKLVAKDTKERKGHNPKTGEEITIPAGRRVAFVTAKALKDALKG